MAKRLHSIKTLYPDVELTLSVLVTITGFDVKDFPRDLIMETTKMGELVIEFPLSGEEVCLGRDTSESKPA